MGGLGSASTSAGQGPTSMLAAAMCTLVSQHLVPVGVMESSTTTCPMGGGSMRTRLSSPMCSRAKVNGVSEGGPYLEGTPSTTGSKSV